MKRIFSLLLLVSSNALASGLQPWEGDWQGTCRLTPAYDGIASFKMRLQVGDTNGGRAAWTVTYEGMGNRPRETRAYEVMAVDAAQGHYAIDEHNGLILDSYLLGSTLYSAFTIGQVLIPARYELTAAGRMTVEMPSLAVVPVRTSCVEGNPQLCARSFRLNSVQRCELQKH
jgi:hypothetical protein